MSFGLSQRQGIKKSAILLVFSLVCRISRLTGNPCCLLGSAIFANHTIIIAGYTIGVVKIIFIGNFMETSNGFFYIQ